MFKNIVDSFKGIVDVAVANINPYKVQEVKIEDYRCFTVHCQDGVLVLYKKHGSYECLLTSICKSQKTFSIFRLTKSGEAMAQFHIFAQKLNLISSASSSIYQEEIIQRLSDCILEHPTWTHTHIAAFVGLYECFKHQEFVSEVNRCCGTSQTVPLMAAVLGKQLRCVQELLNTGAVIERQDSRGETVYHYAVIHNHNIIPVLAQYDTAGVVDWVSNEGKTALYLACEKILPDAVEELLRARADPSVTACGKFPIHIAVRTGDTRVVKMIGEKFKNQLHVQDEKNGGNPLHWATLAETVELLTRMGSNINSQSKTGCTPLHVMLEKSRRDCVLELLCFGADSCIGDQHGNTPLHHAVMKDDVEMTRIFVVFGADVNLLNNNGHTARHLAATSKNKNRDKILFILHVSGAKRCDLGAKGCVKGCVTEGSFNGTPDPTMNAVLDTDRDAIMDEMLSSVLHFAENKEEKKDKLDRVLCLDGGGIRGLVLVQMLMAIEKLAGKPVKDCFDWIGGTSTGGMLALGIACGMSLPYMKGLYFRLKDVAFKGKRPYAAEPFEEMLKKEFGETAVMSDIKHPKVIVTGVLADRFPVELHLFRSFHPTIEKGVYEERKSDKLTFKPLPPPEEQLIWKAARSSGAAPTYFRSHGRFVDGGLMANNPSLDVLAEIQEYNAGLKLRNQGQLEHKIGCFVSLGTGRTPVKAVNNPIDVFIPEGILDVKKSIDGLKGFANVMVEQATCSEGRPVDRTRAWCSMMNAPFYRFSPRFSENYMLDCTDNNKLIQMMWETQCYIVANIHRIQQAACLL